MSEATLRAKFRVTTVAKYVDGDGNVSQEEVKATAVYGKEGTANSQWSKYTPNGQLSLTISNPAAFDKLLPGQQFLLDLISAGDDD